MSVTIHKRIRNGDPAPPPALVPASPAPEARPQTVAAIITCHNYGRWLAQCIESCLAQTLSLACIVVVVDASTDESWEVALRFSDRVKCLKVEYQDVAKARNAALAYLAGNCRTDFVLPVDADNWLPAEYVAALLAGFTANHIGVAYGVRWPHCENGRAISDRPLPLTEFDHAALRVKNFADNCSLIRWEALEQTGGWQPGNFTLKDWILWLRLTAKGWTMRGLPVPFNYRMHKQQMHKQADRIDRVVTAYEQGCKVAVVTLFCGRKLHEPFDVLNRLEWSGELHHVAIDNSNDAQFHHGLSSLLAGANRPFTYRRVDEQALPGVTAGELSNSVALRRKEPYKMQRHMVRLYACAQSLIPQDADFVLTLEADVIPDPKGLRALMRVFAQDHQCGVVAATVPSRFAGALIAWHGESLAKKARFTEYDDTKEPLATTFGFTLWRREVFMRLVFRPCWNWGTQEPAFDHAAGEDVRNAGWKIKLAPVTCQHEG
ncbi:MAG: glycosyltransferase family 2 protein [Verrucomicrobiota bacterium]